MVDVREQEPGGKAFKTIFDLLTANLHTCLPGIITAFDANLRTCSVQPSIKRLYSGEEETTLLPIQEDVPVQYPGSNGFYLEVELAAGDEVLCIVSERAIDNWLDQGGTVDPESPRRFDLSDMIVIPGLRSTTNVQGPVGSGIALRNAGGTVEIRLVDDLISAKLDTVKVELRAGGTPGIIVEPIVPLTPLTHDVSVWDGLGVPLPGTVSLASHTHAGVTVGTGVTGPPVPIPPTP